MLQLGQKKLFKNKMRSKAKAFEAHSISYFMYKKLI